MDRAVLGLHGYSLQDNVNSTQLFGIRAHRCLSFQVGQIQSKVVRPVKSQRDGTWYIAKRLTPPSDLENEAKMLRILSSKSMESPRNPTAFPVAFLWSDRIVVTPLYHESVEAEFSPNSLLLLGKDLFEVRRAIHQVLPLYY